MTLAKFFRITERVKLEIKMAAYNATNSFMGGSPSLNPDSSTFGQVTSQRGNFTGRQFEYSARLIW